MPEYPPQIDFHPMPATVRPLPFRQLHIGLTVAYAHDNYRGLPCVTSLTLESPVNAARRFFGDHVQIRPEPLGTKPDGGGSEKPAAPAIPEGIVVGFVKTAGLYREVVIMPGQKICLFAFPYYTWSKYPAVADITGIVGSDLVVCRNQNDLNKARFHNFTLYGFATWLVENKYKAAFPLYQPYAGGLRLPEPIDG